MYRLEGTKAERKADDERRPLYRVGSEADTMRDARNERPEEGTAERGVRSWADWWLRLSSRQCARKKRQRADLGELAVRNIMVE